MQERIPMFFRRHAPPLWNTKAEPVSMGADSFFAAGSEGEGGSGRRC